MLTENRLNEKLELSIEDIKLEAKSKLKNAIPQVVILLAAAVVTCSGQQATTDSLVMVVDQHPTGPLWLQSVPWSRQEVTSKTPDAARLAMVLDRIGPNIRASTNYHDFSDVHLEESLASWRILHDRIDRIARSLVVSNGPKLEWLLLESKVSDECLRATRRTLDAMRKLETWAIRMWSSTGSLPPAGFLDGQFTDLGSYRDCVAIERVESGEDQLASYCLVPLRPVVPSRKPFHSIMRQDAPELTKLFPEGDVLTRVAKKSQYFHYMYLKTGICVPAQCSPNDIQRSAQMAAKQLGLAIGPVRCYSRSQMARKWINNTALDMGTRPEIENEPLLVPLGGPTSSIQFVAGLLVGGFMGLVLLSTMWHLVEMIRLRRRARTSIWTSSQVAANNDDQHFSHRMDDDKAEKVAHEKQLNLNEKPMRGLKMVAFDWLSLITNWNEFFDTKQRNNEIKCLHGLRALTMLWIISVHTLQYNEWSGFTRVFENEVSFKNPAIQPLVNANYVVDNFFFMSGLLVAYTNWLSNKGNPNNFRLLPALVTRYFRLTPQVLLVSLLYILLPILSDGPFWHDMTAYAAKDCEHNWWVNLLHIQTFYRTDQMCNLVGWWISVDMLYYLVAMVLLILILRKHKRLAVWSCLIGLTISIAISAHRHFIGKYSPNNLGVVPQVAEVWTSYVLYFFWSPYQHCYPFILGFWAGYMLANNQFREQVHRWSLLGWILSITSLLTVNFSSFVWMSGWSDFDNQFISTGYNVICTLVWATSFGWMIVACHYGTAPRLNEILSKLTLVWLSKASFIIYLSHMLVIRLYFGIQNTLLEVSTLNVIYMLLGNIILSVGFGVFLAIVFEGAFLKFQRWLVNRLKAHLLDANHKQQDQQVTFCEHVVMATSGPFIKH